MLHKHYKQGSSYQNIHDTGFPSFRDPNTCKQIILTIQKPKREPPKNLRYTAHSGLATPVTKHLQTALPPPRFEPRLYGKAVNVTNHYTVRAA
ncbi:hypothetical protein TNCV_2390771 [Trichonephila clavipes]|nr:hypothetical protein TNCV_2390771 [Trichonephila clavipes]